MQRLGYTRSTSRADHALLTPDTFIRAPLPGMKNATAIVHAAPAMGASFTEYTAEFEAGGMLGHAMTQRFVYVLDGELTITIGRKRHPLRANGYAYLPEDKEHVVASAGKSRAIVIEKIYQELEGLKQPGVLIGDEGTIVGQPLMGDEALTVRMLIPAGEAFDFAVNTMTFQPGAALSLVEVHVMEHGLVMLEGGGIYRLNESWYPVTAGDFIWMGPYCPQWFGAIGKTPAKYLIYKDWNRHPLSAA
jgi:(S)-ureidoglycine aminohydrolase